MSEVLELRVHGVSNTPPENLLREPGLDDVVAEDLVRVAGDKSTGFYRRPTHSGAGFVTEAYSWGALTAGDRARKDIERAAWALLLPFALANVAIWARPEVPARAEDESNLGQVTAYVVRLLALSLTCTLVLAIAGVAMDQVAWQCHLGGCAKVPPHTDFLRANGMWSQGTRPVALAMAAPLLLLALLAVASLRSFAYEAEQPETTGGDVGTSPISTSPLECLTFWRGDGQIRRLALLHVSAGVIACSTVLLIATWQVDQRVGTSWAVRSGGVLAAVLVAAAAAYCLWVLSTHQVRFRGQQTGSQLPSTGYGRNSPRVFALSIAGAAVAVAYSLVSDRTGTRWDGTLPGYAGTVLTLALCQLVLVLVLIGLCRRGSRRAAAVTSAERTAYADGRSDVAWKGCASALLAGSGWLLGCLYSAGLLFWCADWLNGPATVTSSSSAIAVPSVLLWSGPACSLSHCSLSSCSSSAGGACTPTSTSSATRCSATSGWTQPTPASSTRRVVPVRWVVGGRCTPSPATVYCLESAARPLACCSWQSLAGSAPPAPRHRRNSPTASGRTGSCWSRNGRPTPARPSRAWSSSAWRC